MNRLHKVLAALAAIPLLFALLVGSVLIVALSEGIYTREADILKQEATIGCERATLDSIIHELIRYMKGDISSLDMDAYIGGQMRKVFSERDQAHMVDVKYLMDLGRYAVVVGLVAWLVLWTVALLLGPPVTRGKSVAEAFLIGTGGFFVLVAALAAYIALNFETAFTQFHMVFFNNDLWLLPADSVLLQMMPQEFFVHMATYIGVMFGAGVVLVVGISLLARYLTLRKMRRTTSFEPNAEAIQKNKALAAALREANSASRGEEPVTSVPAMDGERFVLSEDGEEGRPEAEEIFEQFGLSDADDQPLMPDEAPLYAQGAYEEYEEPATHTPQAEYGAQMEQGAEPEWNEETPAAPGEEPMTQYTSPPVQAPQDIALPDSSELAALFKAARASQRQEEPAAETEPPQHGLPLPEERGKEAKAPPPVEGAYTAAEEPEAPDAPKAPAQEQTTASAMSVPPRTLTVTPLEAATVEGAPLTLRVPVRLPASSIDGGRFAKGVKLEFSIELVADEDEDNAQEPPAPQAKQADDLPSMDDIMERLDRIIADLPGEEP